ncbi:hypothetical protein F4558_004822 [Micromonospora profundi]|nr:hypothetical protein [Micromonospora profundi]
MSAAPAGVTAATVATVDGADRVGILHRARDERPGLK